MDHINPPNRGYDLVSGPSLKDRLPKLPLYIWIFIIVLLISLILGGAYLILSRSGMLNNLFKKGEINGEKNITIPYKPTPKPLAHGRQKYLISGSKIGSPKIAEATIDPIDPQKGATQVMEVKILSVDGTTPVTKAEVEIMTDNTSKKATLVLSDGTNLDGIWKGSWTIEDIYDYRYQAVITAENASAGWGVTLTFR